MLTESLVSVLTPGRAARTGGHQRLIRGCSHVHKKYEVIEQESDTIELSRGKSIWWLGLSLDMDSNFLTQLNHVNDAVHFELYHCVNWLYYDPWKYKWNVQVCNYLKAESFLLTNSKSVNNVKSEWMSGSGWTLQLINVETLFVKIFEYCDYVHQLFASECIWWKILPSIY